MIVASAGLFAWLAATAPAPGPTRPRRWVRTLDCERLDPGTASRRFPGEIAPPAPRGDFVERSVLACRQRLLRPDLRLARDEAILASLEGIATSMAEAAAALRPDLADRTWLVEAYDPSGPVAAKVTFATKNALMRHGLSVSDRAPTLAVGDVEVITRLPPDAAYPAACRRYHQTGSLGDGDALLAAVRRDPRETVLHAGLCASGQWTWLR